MLLLMSIKNFEMFKCMLTLICLLGNFDKTGNMYFITFDNEKSRQEIAVYLEYTSSYTYRRRKDFRW